MRMNYSDFFYFYVIATYEFHIIFEFKQGINFIFYIVLCKKLIIKYDTIYLNFSNY